MTTPSEQLASDRRVERRRARIAGIHKGGVAVDERPVKPRDQAPEARGPLSATEPGADPQGHGGKAPVSAPKAPTPAPKTATRSHSTASSKAKGGGK